MKQDRFQLAKEYEEQIKRIREELNRIDKVTRLELRSPCQMTHEYIPDICRDLNEFPKMKAAIRNVLEEELKEYEEKFEKL